MSDLCGGASLPGDVDSDRLVAHPTGQPAAATPICKHQDLFLLFCPLFLSFFFFCILQSRLIVHTVKQTITFPVSGVERVATVSGSSGV